jgi:hypothetical protein
MTRYRTTVFTTVRFDIEHDEPFDNKESVKEAITYLTDFGTAFILADGDWPRIVETDVIEDDVGDMNVPQEE